MQARAEDFEQEGIRALTYGPRPMVAVYSITDGTEGVEVALVRCELV